MNQAVQNNLQKINNLPPEQQQKVRQLLAQKAQEHHQKKQHKPKQPKHKPRIQAKLQEVNGGMVVTK
jgi:hypothetical protein